LGVWATPVEDRRRFPNTLRIQNLIFELDSALAFKFLEAFPVLGCLLRPPSALGLFIAAA
jgi:hypothetical protein